MSLYIAATFARQQEARILRDCLEANGIEVKARWLDQSFPNQNQAGCPDFGIRDCEDIDQSHAVLMLTRDSCSIPATGGGRHTEFGYALASKKILLLYSGIQGVNPCENVFHYLSEVKKCLSFEEILTILKPEI